MAKAHFKFAARVLEHLGAELISSDDIAVYELVKNGFDAGSSIVLVNVEYYLPSMLIDLLRKEFCDEDAIIDRCEITDFVKKVYFNKRVREGDCDVIVSLLSNNIPEEITSDDLFIVLGDFNKIEVIDSGHGMSLEELDDNYLTVGTLHRYLQHKKYIESGVNYPNGQPPTGEKGIGRLSAMRLGSQLEIVAVQSNRKSANILKINWDNFSTSNLINANDVPVDLYSRSIQKYDRSPGTIVRITGLKSCWDHDKTCDVANRFVSKLMDPFKKQMTRKINVVWNGQQVYVPRIGQSYLEAAHNTMKCQMSIQRNGKFLMNTNLTFTSSVGVVKTDSRTETALDFTSIDDEIARLIGPFEVELYHYNRRQLSAIPGIATRKEFKGWLDEWCGGLKLYRDGVRVMPYGQVGVGIRDGARGVAEPYDDWLELDSTALRGRGYRVNRIQIVGCVRISRALNPNLRDQANRQGLIDNDVTRQFVGLLKELVKRFTVDMDIMNRPQADDLESLREQSQVAQDELAIASDNLLDAARKGDREKAAEAKDRLVKAINQIRAIADNTQTALESRQEQRLVVFELAATGQAAEEAAHDLEAELSEAIMELPVLLKASGRDTDLGQSISHFISVFKSLRAQIASFSPAPAKRRRRRTNISVHRLVKLACDMSNRRFKRHGIKLKVIPEKNGEDFDVYAVEGHLRQVLGNLLRNSIFWLQESQRKHPDEFFDPTITVCIDTRSKTVTFSDNGIGISQNDAEWIFERFASKRDDGRGLGLYIAKELCEFNKISIFLDGKIKNKWKRLTTFVIDMSNATSS